MRISSGAEMKASNNDTVVEFEAKGDELHLQIDRDERPGPSINKLIVIKHNGATNEIRLISDDDTVGNFHDEMYELQGFLDKMGYNAACSSDRQGHIISIRDNDDKPAIHVLEDLGTMNKEIPVGAMHGRFADFITRVRPEAEEILRRT